jgi:hypothetical protein
MIRSLNKIISQVQYICVLVNWDPNFGPGSHLKADPGGMPIPVGSKSCWDPTRIPIYSQPGSQWDPTGRALSRWDKATGIPNPFSMGNVSKNWNI